MVTVEYSFSAALILHERKTQGHRKFSSVNFWLACEPRTYFRSSLLSLIFDGLMWAIIQFIMKEAIFQPFWFVFFSFIRMKRGWVDSTVFKFQTENQPNKQTTSTELLYSKSIKRHSGLKHFTVYWFYSLFLEISNDDLKRKNKVKKMTNAVW